MARVYAMSNGIMVTDINSNAFLTDTTGWVQIDEGNGDRYMHAQGNYLPKSLMDEQGRYRYKLVDGMVVERTSEELETDVPIAQAPDATTLLQAQVKALADRNDFMEDCIAEMAMQAYGNA